ncbi:MAG: pilus assembly protein TadG-related protein [Acidimicrobiales bacterium]
MSATPSRTYLRRDERGSILVMATAGIVVALIAGALSIDLGTLAVEARRNQRVADLAAIDSSRMLPSNPTTAAQESATRNGFDYTQTGWALTVQWATSKLGPFTSDTGQLATALVVKVTATSTHQNDLPYVGGGQIVSRSAMATTVGDPIGAVRVGSSAATVTSGGTVLNRLLTQTVGGSYNLSAVGWNGLAAGNVNFERFATALGYSVANPNTVLDASFKYRTLLDAAVTALNADGSPSSITAATFLGTIASQVSATAGADIKLRDLIDISGDVSDGDDVADVVFNVKDMVMGGLILADTDHLATMDLTATDIPGLPGTGVTVKFGLIEAPQTAVGAQKDGNGGYHTIARTAQVKLLVELKVNLSLAAGLITVPLTVPYYIDAAYAEGKLDTIHCTDGTLTPTSVDIYGETQIARTYVGSVTEPSLSTPGASVAATGQLGAVSVNLGVLLGTVSVTVSTTGTVASASVPGHSGTVSFSPPYAGTETHVIPGATTVPLPSLAVGNLDVQLNGAGLVTLGISVDVVKNAVVSLLSPLVTPLNNNLVAPLTSALGLSIGAGDLWAPPPQSCHSVPSLVG